MHEVVDYLVADSPASARARAEVRRAVGISIKFAPLSPRLALIAPETLDSEG